MRNILIVSVLFTFSFVLASCSGGNSDSDGGMKQGDNTSAKSEITNVIDATWDALSAQNLEQFKQYTTPDWRLFTERANKMDATSLINTHSNNLENFNLEYSNLEIKVYDSVAWATYDATMSGLWQGEDWGGEFIFTNILVRENGEWKIAHMHESEGEEVRPGAETVD